MTDKLVFSSVPSGLTALGSARLRLWQQEAVPPINHARLGSQDKASTRHNEFSNRMTSALTAIKGFDRTFGSNTSTNTRGD